MNKNKLKRFLKKKLSSLSSKLESLKKAANKNKLALIQMLLSGWILCRVEMLNAKLSMIHEWLSGALLIIYLSLGSGIEEIGVMLGKLLEVFNATGS